MANALEATVLGENLYDPRLNAMGIAVSLGPEATEVISAVGLVARYGNAHNSRMAGVEADHHAGAENVFWPTRRSPS